MCVVLVDGGGAKAVQKFVSLKIAAISVLAVILHPAWPCPFYTPAELVERPCRFRNSQCFYPPAVRLMVDTIGTSKLSIIERVYSGQGFIIHYVGYILNLMSIIEG